MRAVSLPFTLFGCYLVCASASCVAERQLICFGVGGSVLVLAVVFWRLLLRSGAGNFTLLLGGPC